MGYKWAYVPSGKNHNLSYRGKFAPNFDQRATKFSSSSSGK